MKRQTIINLLLGLLFTISIFSWGFLIGYDSSKLYDSRVNESKDWTDVGGHIDIEYYLEVTPDSIYIENYGTHKVHGGKYSDLYDLILMDNL